MIDREILEEYKQQLADRYTVTELIDLLEENKLIDVWDILEMFEDEIIELKFR